MSGIGRKAGRKPGAIQPPHLKRDLVKVDVSTPSARYYIRQSHSYIAAGKPFPFGTFEDAAPLAVCIWCALSGYSAYGALRQRIDGMLAGEGVPEIDRYDPVKLRSMARDAGLNAAKIGRALGYARNTVLSMLKGSNVYENRVRTLGVDRVERFIRENGGVA